MSQIYITTLILTALCIVFGVILAVAFKKLYVFEDPKIDKIEEMLPGANCGACALPGCRAFAESVVARINNPSKCTVSSTEDIKEIAKYLGIEVSAQTKKVARLQCAGGKNEAHNLIQYKGGISTCRGESVVSGGPKGCTWGCLGLGDCMEACDFDAITMNENGLPTVDPEKCTACNDCVEICPKNLFALIPVTDKLIVQCKSELEGDLALNKCSVACTACSKCAADAPSGLITMEHSLPVINYNNSDLARPDVIARCPTGAIVWLEGDSQFKPIKSSKWALGQVETLSDIKDEYFQ